jgi:hypothetical protein
MQLVEPKLALAPLRGLVVIDEVQRRQDLFAILRVLVDRPDAGERFLVLGSAAPALLTSPPSPDARAAVLPPAPTAIAYCHGSSRTTPSLSVPA